MPTPQYELPFDPGAYAALTELFKGPDGLIRPVPAVELEDFKQQDLSVFCHKEAVYQLPTTELIAWLQEQIAGSRTIEIGAGSGHIGRYIPVIMTDSHIQADPEMKKIYKEMAAETIHYGHDVEKMEAGAAISHHKPQTVLGCWVTEFGENERDRKNSFSYGIREMNFKGRIERYIMIGNEHVHKHKTILRKIPYKTHRFNWLYSRGRYPQGNIIYDFNFKPFL